MTSCTGVSSRSEASVAAADDAADAATNSRCRGPTEWPHRRVRSVYVAFRSVLPRIVLFNSGCKHMDIWMGKRAVTFGTGLRIMLTDTEREFDKEERKEGASVLHGKIPLNCKAVS